MRAPRSPPAWPRLSPATTPDASTGRTVEDPEFERRVFRNFTHDGRILQIPARHRKRMVLLRWLADQFRPGVRYSEAQVSELLGRHFDDYATLRRLLVDNELMQRKAGLYWRAGTLPYPD